MLWLMSLVAICSRVARERAAPGAARAPKLAALSQLFLLVLPPPALSHGRGAAAQPRDGGRAAGSGWPSPARSAGKEGSTCSAELGRGLGRAPRLLGTHRRRNMGVFTGAGASTHTCMSTCIHTHVHLHITLFPIYFIASYFIVPYFPQPKIP